MKELLKVSVIFYSILTLLFLVLGVWFNPLWFLPLPLVAVGVVFDVMSYNRWKQGKGVLTFRGLLNYYKKPPVDDEKKFICASCGEHVDKVTFDEDRDNDFCDDCY